MTSFVQHYGYVAVFVLAMAESACIPVPSEIIFPLAGALCTTAVATGSPLNVVAVIVLGVVGELVGATIAYVVGRTAGRAIVDRWGKWLLLSHRDLDRAETWFHRYGGRSIVAARIIPVVRSLVSLPAGVAEMPVGTFLALTALGSAVWVSVLTGFGYAAGSNWHRVEHAVHYAEYPAVALVVLLIAGAYLHRWRSIRHETTP